MKLIDADALLRALPDELPYKGSVRRVLMQAPEVDAVPVVHGRWIPAKYTTRENEDCSNCGYSTYYGNGYDYCPNCGAKMDGGSDL